MKISKLTQPHIFLIVEVPFSTRDYDRFGVATFLDQGIEVIVLEVGAITGVSAHKKSSDEITIAGFQVRRINDQESWRAERPNLNNAALIICGFGGGYVFRDTYSVYRQIAAAKTPFLILMSNYLPFTGAHSPKRLTKLLKRFSRLDLAKTIFARLPPSLIGLRPADFVVYGGTKSVVPRRLVTAKTTPIHAHAMDYDQILRFGPPPKMIDKSHAVFIDQGFGYHPDARQLGIGGVVNPDVYYPALRRFFDRVEAELNMRVIIAAHPRVTYDDKDGTFGARQCFYGKTTELIRESSLVISAYSTALGQAILYNKPIILHATAGLIENPHLEGFIESFAARLGIVPVMIDEDPNVDLRKAALIDAKKRRSYIKEYMKWPGSSEKPYWEIVIDALQSHCVLPPNSAPDTLIEGYMAG